MCCFFKTLKIKNLTFNYKIICFYKNLNINKIFYIFNIIQIKDLKIIIYLYYK